MDNRKGMDPTVSSTIFQPRRIPPLLYPVYKYGKEGLQNYECCKNIVPFGNNPQRRIHPLRLPNGTVLRTPYSQGLHIDASSLVRRSKMSVIGRCSN